MTSRRWRGGCRACLRTPLPPADSVRSGQDPWPVERSETALGRAFARIQGAFRGYADLPFALQLSLAAAVVLILGCLAPWVDSDDFLTSYVAGIDTNVGELTLVTGVL